MRKFLSEVRAAAGELRWILPMLMAGAGIWLWRQATGKANFKNAE